MLFTHDTELVLASTARLINTDSKDGDTLTSLDELEDLVTDGEYTGSRTHDRDELDAVRALRPRLRASWSMEVDDLAAEVNALLREAHALPQLVTHDDLGYHIHAISSERPLADRIAVEFAMAVIDVIRTGELDRLRTCASGDCDSVLVDLSRNHSKRFCSTTCGNRESAAAYRARRRA